MPHAFDVRRLVRLSLPALVTALLLATASVAPAVAAPHELAASADASRWQRDASFAADAMRHSTVAARAAHLALDRSHDVRVRQFAERVLRDHTQLAQRLRRLGAREAPVGLAYGRLRGVAFDRAFVEDRVAQERAAIAAYERQARSRQDRRLSRFAEETLPTLRRHLAAAEALQAQFELRRRNFADPS
ncbi:DUF4142 domain-containing protein [Ramlibacter sp. USB13]|uniref:DUF4142 domain-containing protein n=1 Tax=Ramlibacter cellulosilyticus TaxID=2764187 RepID=A0A923MUU4_9BURK|nr:DUF4142 domain-containing protein [Ramlibacter cellulosilyticus]MBC5785436.1 DUF4142 domain-containing protein [Ramlibacter cellulosilyticus]